MSVRAWHLFHIMMRGSFRRFLNRALMTSIWSRRRRDWVRNVREIILRVIWMNRSLRKNTHQIYLSNMHQYHQQEITYTTLKCQSSQKRSRKRPTKFKIEAKEIGPDQSSRQPNALNSYNTSTNSTYIIGSVNVDNSIFKARNPKMVRQELEQNRTLRI